MILWRSIYKRWGFVCLFCGFWGGFFPHCIIYVKTLYITYPFQHEIKKDNWISFLFLKCPLFNSQTRIPFLKNKTINIYTMLKVHPETIGNICWIQKKTHLYPPPPKKSKPKNPNQTFYTQNLVKIEHRDSTRDRKICFGVVVLN